jgi:hypothetical protein
MRCKQFSRYFFGLGAAIFSLSGAWAKNTGEDLTILDAPTGTWAALSGGGVAAAGDSSVIDVNPALLAAIEKQYTLFGAMSKQTHVNLWEAGILDNTTSALAGEIRVRQTIPNETGRDRRISAALAGQVEKTNLSLGLGITWDQFGLNTTDFKYDSDNWSVSPGLLYQKTFRSGVPMFFGLSLVKLGDKYDPNYLYAGLSTSLFNRILSLNMDTRTSSESGFVSVIGGATVTAHDFLELRGSGGYNPRDARSFWGTGIFFNAPILHLYYTVARLDMDDTTVRHTLGLALSFQF